MTSQKPYLIRAIYEWLIDNELTPYLLVSTEHEGVQVPSEHIHEGKIVLNIAPNAVRNFLADNEWISFSARFSGKAMELFIPIAAIQAIYGKENNEGMFFPDDDSSPPPSPTKINKPPKSNSNTNKPSLKVVK